MRNQINFSEFEIGFLCKEESKFILMNTNCREDLYTVDILEDDHSARTNDVSTNKENMYIKDAKLQVLPLIVRHQKRYKNFYST